MTPQGVKGSRSQGVKETVNRSVSGSAEDFNKLSPEWAYRDAMMNPARTREP